MAWVSRRRDVTIYKGQKRRCWYSLSMLPRSPAAKLELSPAGMISKAHIRRRDQTREAIQAKILVMACNAPETPRLLLASRCAALPERVANRPVEVPADASLIIPEPFRHTNVIATAL